jgi:DNA-binding LacI/PurR family transcriptional regulator
MRRLGLPAVLVGAPYDDDPIPHVQPADQAAGIREAVRHLVELGHRRIAYVAGPEDRVHTVFRRRTVEQALAEADLSPVEVVASDFTQAAAAEATERLLTRRPRPTAILYANDTMAICGMSTAQRLGVRVPSGLSVVGYDDLPICRWVHPELTTVSQPVQDVGQAAARRLLALCGEEVADAPLALRPHLVVRSSTGRARR